MHSDGDAPAKTHRVYCISLNKEAGFANLSFRLQSSSEAGSGATGMCRIPTYHMVVGIQTLVLLTLKQALIAAESCF